MDMFHPDDVETSVEAEVSVLLKINVFSLVRLAVD